MKKRLLLKLGLVALLGAGLFVVWLWWTEPRTGICRYTASRIKEVMSKEEVDAIIGLEPGVYTDGIREDLDAGRWNTVMATRSPSVYEQWDKDQIPRRLEKLIKYNNNWMSDSGLLTVYYDKNDKVVFRFYGDLETTYDKVRRCLHLEPIRP